MEEWRLQGANGVETPLVEDTRGSRDALPKLPAAEASAFRAAVAKLNYLTQDRIDIATATNLLARWMSKPREGDSVALKRVLRYLRYHPECILTSPYHDFQTNVMGTTDYDWAGCREARRYTSGLVVQRGRAYHLLWEEDTKEEML